MNKQSKILITGHKGLVGSALLKKLRNEEYENIIYFNKKRYDLRNQYNVNILFQKYKPEFVFNCAGKVGGIKANMENQYDFLYDNIMIQTNIINSCLKYNVQKSIILGSSCIYGYKENGYLNENDLLNGELEPTNLGYSLAKISGLKLAEYANEKNKCEFVSLMPCNLYGIGNDYDINHSHVLQAILKKCVHAYKNNEKNIEVWGNGESKREFLYVDDLIDCMLWSIFNIKKTKTFLNVGTGKDISINELVYLIGEILHYDFKIIYDKTKPVGMFKKVMNVSNINKLGWKYKISLKEGIKKLLKHDFNINI